MTNHDAALASPSEKNSRGKHQDERLTLTDADWASLEATVNEGLLVEAVGEGLVTAFEDIFTRRVAAAKAELLEGIANESLEATGVMERVLDALNGATRGEEAP